MGNYEEEQLRLLQSIDQNLMNRGNNLPQRSTPVLGQMDNQVVGYIVLAAVIGMVFYLLSTIPRRKR